MNKIEGVIFDWAGTTATELTRLTTCFQMGRDLMQEVYKKMLGINTNWGRVKMFFPFLIQKIRLTEHSSEKAPTKNLIYLKKERFLLGIRKAKIDDWKSICELLNQLEYYNTENFMKEKIETLFNDPGEELIVYERLGKVIAFISIHFIPQLALKGDFARISYFSVDSTIRSKGIGREMEEYCTDLAKKRNCDRIEVHCHSRRKNAHRFYLRQGFNESPKYFVKML